VFVGSLGLKPSNESLEVVLARPVTARRADQAGAWKVTDNNALFTKPSDEGLRVLGSPGDQGRLIRPRDYVRAMLEEQRTAALSRLARSHEALFSGLRCERKRG
jgi:hypothetical protein